MHIIKPAILFVLFYLGIVHVHGQATVVLKTPKDTGSFKTDTLKAAIVTARIRPRVKGDTLEYSTSNIRMRPDATVDELLGRLPGLVIDANGNIIYNGEKIQHLLVDGEDIFASDPTLVIRNFDAGKISKIQVLNRKSEQAIFTGIDDGTRTKTINLVMKENAKDGYFGKLEAGGNSEGYYNGNGVFAGFRDKEQFTALALASNTGMLGFSTNAGGTSAGVSFQGNADPLGASAGTGIPRFVATALHYANSWNGPQDHISANYQYGNYFTRPVTGMQIYQIQANGIYGQEQLSQSVNRQDQHWAYGVYDWAPGQSSAFRFTFHGSSTVGQNQLGATGISTLNDTLVNSSQRSIQDNLTKQNIGGDASWRIQPGRRADGTFSVNAGFNMNDNVIGGYLLSINSFYQPDGHIEATDTVDQRKQITNHALAINGTINYMEPLWKGAAMGLSYALVYSSDDPSQSAFARGDGKYQILVDSLSNQLRTQTINQRAMFNLQGKSGRLTYTIGNDWLGYNYRQQNLFLDSTLHIQHSNWAPRIMLNYTENSATNLKLSYNAVTQPPSISQLQPTKNNNDPLHISLGNPDLKPGLNQNFYLDFQHFTTWLINFTANLTLISNSISTKTTTDGMGRQISQPVNVDGSKTAGLNIMVNRRVWGFDAGFHAVGTWFHSVNYINNDLSRNDAYTGGCGFSLNKYMADKYSLQINTNFSYFDQITSVRTAAPVHYWTQSHQWAVTIFFIRNFDINTNATYTWQEKASVFTTNTSILLWNAYVSRCFLHNKLVAKFQFNNILNQNAGISRASVANVNTQTSTNILGRYWMLSAIYHFEKKFKRK